MMIELDGSESAGHLLRVALALSMCSGRPFTLENIHAHRLLKGLKPWHLACVQAAAAICDADMEGAELESRLLTFKPGKVKPGDYTFDAGLAGNCGWVLQTVWPALMLCDAPSRLRLTGGTNHPSAPSYHFLQRCFVPLMERLGARIDLDLHRMGFSPDASGEMEATIYPASDSLAPFSIGERGPLVEVFAESLAPGLPVSVARNELNHLAEYLRWQGKPMRRLETEDGENTGHALMATLKYREITEMFTRNGDPQAPATAAAEALATQVRAYQRSGAAFGPHLADQWAAPLAVALWLREGSVRYTCTENTPHMITNSRTIHEFVDVYFDSLPINGMWYVSATLEEWPPRGMVYEGLGAYMLKSGESTS